MRIYLEDGNRLLSFNLSKEVVGNYWLTDSKRNNIINIEGENNKWLLKSNIEYKILKDINVKDNQLLTNINQLNNIELIDYMNIYIIELATNKIYKIYVLPAYDKTMEQYVVDFNNVNEIVFGNDNNNIINCRNSIFSKNQIVIKYENSSLNIINNNLKVNMFVNNILESNKILFSGDMVFINGIMFCFIGNLLLINNPNNIINFNTLKINKRLLPTNNLKDYSNEQEVFVEMFNKNEYFQRPPRFKRIIEPKVFNIDPPTGGNKNNYEMPLIYTLGPMMLMGVTSIASSFTAVSNVLSGKSTFKDNVSAIITTVSMLGTMLIFPLLQRLYTKKTKFSNERKRKRKYKKYIEKKKNEILKEIEIQKQILIENNVDLISAANVILNHERTLWDRKKEHPDFLTVRLGIGNVKPQIEINYPEEHFTMEEDVLDDVYNELFDSIKDIENVPVTLNLVKKRFTGIVGDYTLTSKFLDGILLNVLAFHSYDILKIVVFTSEEKRINWEKYRNIPHFWSNEKNIRFIGIGSDDINKISNNLMQIYNERINNLPDNPDDVELYKSYKEYYLIICDEVDYIKNTTIYNEIIKNKYNLGFSFLLVSDRIDSLPNEFSSFINIEPNNCGLFENELISTNIINFKADIPNFNMNSCYTKLCNIPIDIDAGKFLLPKMYSFLEMYGVGNVNQLNIYNRWKNNNILQSLSAPVGINEQGEIFKIDLHEKAHGPHGLVAGMTGSGKSEWIISYILSMAINYHPYEVQFVLIDYKGGGLAGTFENKETGVKLPHLAGTITNLDVNEMSRSLISINSELKRRQALFNQARDKLGESSVDIYKYQKWYREKRIDTPISHLFIISDEFAELKAQQPEFMAELISAARIGRSLGVHLILATQKPGGVVDDQIWSNSKFRVCLKVQDRSDSNDMLKCPDAAYLKETGRFYLQVGYNEFFAKGQSAYAGAPYYESDKHKNVIDTDLLFLNDIGEVYKEINSEKNNTSLVFKGEELPNIMNEIINVSKNENISINKLWLDSIPEKIYFDSLIKKYEYQKQNFVLNPVIGEYDAPELQKQGLLTLPISSNGNHVIYGITGSGKEMILTQILYSLMITHYKEEVNVYLLDFGAEVLGCFKNSPIVADIIQSTDVEKIKNYYKFIIKEYNIRKKLFQDYNADYLYYCSNSGQTVPNILTIINNYDNYKEIIGDEYDDLLLKIIRDGEKYGMYFIITCNSSNSLSYKLSQQIKNNICLQLNDIFDYKTLIGANGRTSPMAYKGRGLVNIGNVYEFQTCIPINHNNLTEYISKLCLDLSQKNGKATSIKTVPKIIDYDYIKDYLEDLSNLPIGVFVDDISIARYDFSKKSSTISSEDYLLLNPFINSIVDFIANKKDSLKAIIFDGYNNLNIIKDNITYINDNYLGSLVSFNKFLDNVNENTKESLIIFYGLNNILLNENKFENVLKIILNKINKIDKMHILFVDEVNSLSILYNKEFSIDINNYIWVGNGISNQYILKNSVNNKKIESNYGYVITSSKGKMFKTIEFFRGDNDEE